MNVKTLTYSQQQAQGPKTDKKEVNNQSDLWNSVLCPPKVPLYRFLVFDEVKCKTHTQQQNSVENLLKAVNLTENDTKTLSSSLLLL